MCERREKKKKKAERKKKKEERKTEDRPQKSFQVRGRLEDKVGALASVCV